MNKRSLSALCAAMLLFSVLIRTALAAGIDLPAEQPAAEFARWMLLSETGRAAPMPDEPTEQRVWRLHILEQAKHVPLRELLPQSREPEPEPGPEMPAAFTAAEAEAIEISGGCTYAVDKTSLLLRPSAMDFSGGGPKVLIVHTHSSEAYTPHSGWEYEQSDLLRTEDPMRSVIRVGSEIAEVLEAAGIETLHDTALNDYPTYSGAYARMEATIKGYLAEYPSIQMVLDVHRDAAEDANGMQVAFTRQIEGENCAQVMLVVGTDEGGLEHPDWQENLANALKLQAILNRKFPGLCRPIDLRTERFNAHLTKGSVLAEFGCTGNTLAQAIRAGRHFAEGLVELIRTLTP